MMQSITRTGPTFEKHNLSRWWSPTSFLLGVFVGISFLSFEFEFLKLKPESDSPVLKINGKYTGVEPLPEPKTKPEFEDASALRFNGKHAGVEPRPDFEHTPSGKFIDGMYGRKPFTPKYVVGITSFLMDKKELMSHSFSDLHKDREALVPKTAQTLNFVVAGFPKTGTTFLMKMLNNDAIEMIQGEQCQFGACTGYSLGKRSGLADKEPLTLVNKLIEVREEMPQKKIAIKCPNTIEDDVVDELYPTYFPNASMVIGLRHPVRWFESFYNHRLRTEFNPAPLAYDLIGSGCHQGYPGKVCTDRAKFALPLSKLGLTNLTDVEVALLTDMVHASDSYRDEKKKTIESFLRGKKSEKASIGKIFVYDLGQLADEDDERLKIFGEDLGEFLELDEPLVIPHRDPRDVEEEEDEPSGRQRRLEMQPEKALRDLEKPIAKTAGYIDYTMWWRYPWWKKPDNTKNEIKARHEKIRMNICDELYDDLRQEMVEDAKKTTEWILNYFLKSENVIVSQRAFLESLIAQYAIDPCLES